MSKVRITRTLEYVGDDAAISATMQANAVKNGEVLSTPFMTIREVSQTVTEDREQEYAECDCLGSGCAKCQTRERAAL